MWGVRGWLGSAIVVPFIGATLQELSTLLHAFESIHGDEIIVNTISLTVLGFAGSTCVCGTGEGSTDVQVVGAFERLSYT